MTTPQRWDTMADAEKRAMVAECMGCDALRVYQGAACISVCRCVDGTHTDGGIEGYIKPYATDHTAVVLVRAEVARRGWQDVFAHHLYAVLGQPGSVGGAAWEDAFDYVNATPDQQCLAFVRAYGREV